MATIRQRNNRWQCIVKRKGYPIRTHTFDLKKDAEKWGRLQERLIDAGEWVDRTEAEQTTLGELLERYAKEVSTSKRGGMIECARICRFQKSSLASYAVASITGRLIAQWRDNRLKEVSSSTVAREMNLLSHVFAIAIREWGLGLNGNPVSLISKPPPAAARDRVLTDSEREKLLQALSSCRNPWVKPVVLFALETAARRGEILALTWDAINLEKQTANLTGKTGRRTIPLSPRCVALLRGLPRSMNGRVFPITVEALKQAYERSVARAGLVNLTFHDLRHDALTRLARIGLNVLELRAISGHTTATMLQRYVAIDAGDLAQKIAKAS